MRDIIIAMGACTESNVNRVRFNGFDFAALHWMPEQACPGMSLAGVRHDNAAGAQENTAGLKSSALMMLALSPVARSTNKPCRSAYFAPAPSASSRWPCGPWTNSAGARPTSTPVAPPCAASRQDNNASPPPSDAPMGAPCMCAKRPRPIRRRRRSTMRWALLPHRESSTRRSCNSVPGRQL